MNKRCDNKNAKRPNILLLYPDQHRGDWMPYAQEVMASLGMEPLPIKMPNVEKLMKEGMTFTRCVTSSPLCAPARACLASGLRYDKCQVESNAVDYPVNQRTFYSVLKESGYNVGGVGKFDLHKPTHWWGLDGWIDDMSKMGFTHGIDNAGKIDAIVSGVDEPKDPYMSYLYREGLAELHINDMTGRKNKTHATPLNEDAYCDNWIGKNAIKMIQSFDTENPWFIQVNFTGPHPPWDVTDRMKSKWSSVEFPEPADWDHSQSNIQEIRQNYAAMLDNIDRNIGNIINELKRRGDYDNTVIIYSSDHGEMLGDFGEFHKSKPERGAVHIPLVIAGPGVSKGKYSKTLAETQDLAKTIVDYAGGFMPEAVDSESLKSVLEGDQDNVRKYQVSAYKDWKTVITDNFKYIKQIGIEDRLYNIQSDPWERYNVAGDYPEFVEELKNMIV